MVWKNVIEKIYAYENDLFYRYNIKMQCTKEHLMPTNKLQRLKESRGSTEDSGYHASRLVSTISR